MVLPVLFGVVGLALLAVAADQLVLGAGRVAARLGIAPVFVGVVIIGLGTSAPEFLVSALAAGRGDSGLAVGNLAGSNILNLTLILGVAALVTPIRVASTIPRREAALTAGGTLAFAVAVAAGLGWVTGAALAVLAVAALVLLVLLARVPAADPLVEDVTEFLDHQPSPRLPVELVRTVLGLAGTVAGAHLVAVSGADLAGRLGVPQAVIGFTLVALGTSLPELVTAIQAHRRGEVDLLVGNLLGSNLFNSLAGGALVGLVAGQPVRHVLSLWILVAMVGVTLLAWLLLRSGHRVTRGEAVLLLAVYLLILPLLR